MRPVYPRWRGELLVVRRFEENKNGLSPLARGTPPLRSSTRSISRFIPAGAGNSSTSLRISGSIAVYPRWLGELAVDFAGVVSAGGLSPLARGTHGLRYMQCPDSRFIPAGAGNTKPPARPPITTPVYPRWRGEHAMDQGITLDGGGLSPLARGTH